MSITQSKGQQPGKYWKSLSDLATGSEVAKEYIAEDREFPDGHDQAPTPSSGVNRRQFMGLLSASMAVAATSCRRPDHKLIPTVKAVEYITPGLPNYYTSVFTKGNAAFGLLVKSREGRPVKIEGNDKDPVTKGTSSSLIQATLLSLYDPDRISSARLNKGFSSSANVISSIVSAARAAESQGKTVRIVIDEHASPSFASLVSKIQQSLPNIKFVTLPALRFDHIARGNKAVSGMDTVFVPDYSKADTIFSLDSDFLGTDVNATLHIRNFASKRKPSKASPIMNKLIVAETAMSLTGMQADERIKLAPDELEQFMTAIFKEVTGRTGMLTTLASKVNEGTLASDKKQRAQKVAEELVSAHGKVGLVSVGAHLPANVHALALATNMALGAFGEGKAINPQHQLPFSHDKSTDLEAFRAELKAGSIGVVIFADTNPYYSSDKELCKLLDGVRKYAVTLHDNETASVAEGFIPVAHYLESWGDAVAFDGTMMIQQPIIAPLNDSSLSVADFVIAFANALTPGIVEQPTYVEYIRKRWESASLEKDKDAFFDDFWIATLRDGIFSPAKKSEGFASVVVNVNESSAAEFIATKNGTVTKQGGVVALITPSYALYDGKYANNGWLLELPDPVNKITWDNVAAMSVKTCDTLLGAEFTQRIMGGYDPVKGSGYQASEKVRVSTEHGTIELPVWIQPGMTDGVVAISTGFGRSKGGVVQNNVGANAFALMGSSASYGYVNVKEIVATGERHKVATTQKHHDVMGRKIVQETTFQEVVKGGELFERPEVPGQKKKGDPVPSITTSYLYKGHRWGMTIDMSACTGCSACVVACQAENNIPNVGREQVLNGREMHWIRIDRYYSGDVENPQAIIQPMLCQHCENAPCENVCPVAATTHSPEGLNEMTYNRCVGTRYCSNNCPYKVRRFNYLNWHKGKRTPMEFTYNPDVTLRMRGVIEKCSFCVQRIQEAKHHAKDQGRTRVQDGEVITACQQACPAGAIVFGDTNDDSSKVSSLRKDDRGFLVLEELNVRPQITYLAKVRNSEQHHASEKHS